MDSRDILRIRLRSQLIKGSAESTPRDVVSHLLAMQAQDYAGAMWAVGLRLPGSTLADVERAIAEGAIVRTWPMRGTLHFVAAEDVHWLLPLLAPRVIARAATRERGLELDDATFGRARGLFEGALSGGRALTRPDAMTLLETDGIATTGQRGYHILWRLAQEGLLVVGPMEGRQQTFRLLAEWVPAEKSALPLSAPRQELLAVLAMRFFRGHGPATVGDLARWAGVTKREAAAALAAVERSLESAEGEGERYWFAPEAAAGGDGATGAGAASAGAGGSAGVHLLPGFDEYLLGYGARGHQMGDHLETYGTHVASNGMFAPTVVVGGRVVGVWKRTLSAKAVRFRVTEFERLSRDERSAIAAEQKRFALFVGREVAKD